MAGTLDDEFLALPQFCKVHPGSAVLLRALLATATKAGRLDDARQFLAALSLDAVTDEVLRSEIQEFLVEAGAADDARRWRVAPVVQLASRRAPLAPEAQGGKSCTFADVGGLVSSPWSSR